MTSKEPRGISEQEIKAALAVIAGDVFELFVRDYPVDRQYYWLDTNLLGCAIQNAATHINRAGTYHSNTGANIFKKAAYIGKSISISRPVQVARTFPVNLTNNTHLAVLRINANFAVYALEAMLGKYTLYDQLMREVRYCFEFRQRMDEDSLAMLLEHSLRHSPEYYSRQKP